MLPNQKYIEKIKSPKTFIIIPLLREQEKVRELFYSFYNLIGEDEGISLVFVTTEREAIERGNKKEATTMELIEEIIKDNKNFNRFQHIHYPRFNNVVGEQLNYAIQELRNQLEENDFLLFYNADSIINDETIEYVNKIVGNYRDIVFQQSSLFLSNVPILMQRNRILTASFGLYQSYWTLRHEIPQYYINTDYFPLSLINYNSRLAYCVTHGLLIPHKILKKIKYFPQYKIGGEDLALGFFIRANNYKIRILPVLENSETPTSLKSIFVQLPNWFLATLGYFRFWKDKERIENNNSASPFFLAFQGIYRSIRWLLKGFLILFYLMVSLKNSTIIFGFIIYYITVSLPLFMVFDIWNRLPIAQFPRVSFESKLKIAAVYWIVPILQSFPAVVGLWWGLKILMGENFVKSKTE